MSDGEEEYEQATPEEKLRIATHFLLKSPNGQIDAVLKDVRTLVNDEEVLSSIVTEQVLREYNSKQYVFASLPEGDKYFVSEFGCVRDSVYFYPKTKSFFEFNHVSREWKAVSDPEDSDKKAVDAYSNNALRDELEKAVEKYIDSNFVLKENSASAVFIAGSELVVCISAKKVNLRSFWSGGWQSTYRFTQKMGKVEVSTDIRCNVHYFEGGNVQLNSNFDKGFEFEAVSDEEETAKSFVEKVRDLENEFQKKMEEMYVNMHSKSFKAMRRFLPVTRQPMDWSVASHKIASQMGQ